MRRWPIGLTGFTTGGGAAARGDSGTACEDSGSSGRSELGTQPSLAERDWPVELGLRTTLEVDDCELDDCEPDGVKL